MQPHSTMGARDKTSRAPALALSHGEQGHAAVGIGHDPSPGRERRRDDEFAPLESIGVCRDDGYPDKQREHAHLQYREHGCQPCTHTEEHGHPLR